MDANIYKPGDENLPTVQEVADAVLSFNDPNLVTALFNQMGWSLSFEIEETLKIAKQDKLCPAKLSAIKYLRELLTQAAQAAGMMGSVSQTINTPQGPATFTGHNMMRIFSQTKKPVESVVKETSNVEETQTEEPTALPGTSSNIRTPVGPTPGSAPGSELQDGVLERTRSESGPVSGPTLPEGFEKYASADEDGDGAGDAPDSGTSFHPDICGSGSGLGSRQDSDSGEDCGITEFFLDDAGKSGLPVDSDTDPCCQYRPPEHKQELYPGLSGNKSGTTPRS